MTYSKNYICKFMQANSWDHKLFHFNLSFWIWKVWKGREITKIWISPERKELFRWNKKHHSFWRARYKNITTRISSFFKKVSIVDFQLLFRIALPKELIKYLLQFNNKETRTTSMYIILVIYCWLWAGKYPTDIVSVVYLEHYLHLWLFNP